MTNSCLSMHKCPQRLIYIDPHSREPAPELSSDCTCTPTHRVSKCTFKHSKHLHVDHGRRDGGTCDTSTQKAMAGRLSSMKAA